MKQILKIFDIFSPKAISILITAAVCILSSCEKEKTTAEKLVGDWHCQATSIDAELYVTFTAEKTFVLYQQIGEGAFRVYNGTYNLKATDAGNILCGEYNDGKPWGSEYVLAFNEGGFTLTAGDVSETYSRLTDGIPQEVTASCVTVVKSPSYPY